jgi:hypothetical protein
MTTSAANGKAYGALPGNSLTEIADFTGRVVLDGAFKGIYSTERERFVKSVKYTGGLFALVFEEMVFDASVLDLLWSITTNASGLLNDGVTAATTYDIKQSSKPQAIHVLFQMTETGSLKKLEIEANKAYCETLQLVLPIVNVAVHDCRWILLADSNGLVVRVAEEN